MHYLQVTLKPIIDEVRRSILTSFKGFSRAWMFSEFADSLQICTEHKPCEIDPVKLKESENLETNRVRGDGWMM